MINEDPKEVRKYKDWATPYMVRLDLGTGQRFLPPTVQ